MSARKISVIVPIYNSEAYLPRCIESIQKQSYSNLELLLIDDGSSDDSLTLCRKYAKTDPRIRVIHQENRGVSAARNAGLEAMTGDCFTFVDSDDALLEHALALLVKDLEEQGADLSLAIKSAVRPDGTVSTPGEDHSLILRSGDEMLKLSLEGEAQTNSACAKLFDRAFFQSVRFVEGRSVNEDGFFLFQCYALRPKTVQHNESVYLYYLRDGSNSRDSVSEKHLDMLYFCQRKKEIVRDSFPALADLLVSMELRTDLAFLGVLCRTRDRRFLEQQRDCIRTVKTLYPAFRSPRKHERRMAWIVAHGFYPLYKAIFYRKYSR